jgi:hypothetical protein
MRLAPNALVSTTNFLECPPCVTLRHRSDVDSGLIRPRHPGGLGYVFEHQQKHVKHTYKSQETSTMLKDARQIVR